MSRTQYTQHHYFFIVLNQSESRSIKNLIRQKKSYVIYTSIMSLIHIMFPRMFAHKAFVYRICSHVSHMYHYECCSPSIPYVPYGHDLQTNNNTCFFRRNSFHQLFIDQNLICFYCCLLNFQ